MSLLRDYMATYGSRLDSLLGDAVRTSMTPSAPPELQGGSQTGAQTFPMGSNPAPPMQWESMQQQPPSMQQQAPQSALAQAAPAEEARADFRSQWEATPPKERKKQVDALEEAVGSIDRAYDEMIAQLGTRPSGKLSREDKGMLLMEFGLALLANSRPGVSLGEAVGTAGTQTMGTFKELTRGRQLQHDQNVRAVNLERAKAKSELAKSAATESMKAATRASELGRIRGTVTTEGGELYGYTGEGGTVPLRDPQSGEHLRGRERPTSALVPVLDDNGEEIWVTREQAVGRRKRPPKSGSGSDDGGLSAADTNAIYRQSAGLFGGTFDPITGRIAGLNREESQTVQSIAARASQMYMQAGGKLDHATAVERAFQEVRDGARAPTPSDQPRTFASEDEVADAFQRGEIQKGDVVSINGRQFKVQ